MVHLLHERNIQNLLIEMFKAKNKLEPSLLQNIFEASDYQGPTLRSSTFFTRPGFRTKSYGEKSLQNLGVLIWNQLPTNVQNMNSLSNFKTYIKKWKPIKCPCDLCKHYVRGLGIVNACNCQNCY